MFIHTTEWGSGKKAASEKRRKSTKSLHPTAGGCAAENVHVAISLAKINLVLPQNYVMQVKHRDVLISSVNLFLRSSDCSDHTCMSGLTTIFEHHKLFLQLKIAQLVQHINSIVLYICIFISLLGHCMSDNIFACSWHPVHCKTTCLPTFVTNVHAVTDLLNKLTATE